MLKKYLSSLIGLTVSCSALIAVNSPAKAQISPLASANGKYGNLIQVINCPSDASQYGQFSDYGYWQGGAWCGQNGRSGYWVWLAPNWYVWQSETAFLASANGKYANLIQVVSCPSDANQYGEFSDYGYWQGGAWCGQTGKSGYWVWSAPNWYVWQYKR